MQIDPCNHCDYDYSPMTLVSGNTRFLWILLEFPGEATVTYCYRNWKKVDIASFRRYLLPLSSRTQPLSDADICDVLLNDDLRSALDSSIVACSKYKVKAEKSRATVILSEYRLF